MPFDPQPARSHVGDGSLSRRIGWAGPASIGGEERRSRERLGDGLLGPRTLDSLEISLLHGSGRVTGAHASDRLSVVHA